jgi:hypothetical protein
VNQLVVSIPANVSSSVETYFITVDGKTLTGATFESVVSIVVNPSAAETYVALGDSYSSGEGNPGKSWVDHTGTPTNDINSTNGCDRSASAFPIQLEKWLGSNKQFKGIDLSFLACSGATTSNLFNSPAPSVGLRPESTTGGEELQLLDTKELSNARIVTVSIGGDDLYFSDILKHCLTTNRNDCHDTSSDPWIANLITNIQDSLGPVLVATYHQIEREAKNAALYVVGYPNIFPTSTKSSCGLLSSAATQYLIQAQADLDTVIADAAESAKAYFVNPNSSSDGNYSFAGHDVCGENSWFNKLNLTEHQYSYHPNGPGMTALFKDTEAQIKSNSAPTGLKSTLVWAPDSCDSSCSQSASTMQDELTALGYDSTQLTSLPADLSSYGAIFFVDAYHPLTSDEISQLTAFEKGGGGLFLTGERECCTAQNATVQTLLNGILKSSNLDLTSITDPVGSDPQAINPDTIDGLATTPNVLTTWTPSATGGIVGVSGANVFIASPSGVALAAAWDTQSTVAIDGGRIVVMMDVNWLNPGYDDPTTVPQIIENIAAFLM